MWKHRPSSTSSRGLGFFLALCLLVPLLVGVLWGDIYSDVTYQQFQKARSVARGVDESWDGFSPLLTALLASVIRLSWPVSFIAALLSVSGWMLAIAAWFFTGLALKRPAFSIAAAVLLALHPLQPQVLGLESGLVLGLLGLITLLAVRGRTVAILLAMVALVATQPMMLCFAAPLFVYSRVWRRSSPTHVQVTLSVFIGASCYALVYALNGACREGVGTYSDLRPIVPLLASLHLLAASGFAVVVPHFDWLAQPDTGKRALYRGIVSLCLLALVFWQGNTLFQQWRMRPRDRLTLSRRIAQWLNDHALPSETIATPYVGLMGYLADSNTLALPDSPEASALLSTIDHLRPDYCVALNSVAWHSARSQLWFQERYQQVYQVSNPYDSAAPLTVFRYSPSPYDVGEINRVAARFSPNAEEWVDLTGYRLDSPRLAPAEPLHLTLYWRAATKISPPLFLVIRLKDATTGKIWARVENHFPGGLATDLWNPGTQLVDRYVLVPPADLPEGDYALEVAFFSHDDSSVPILAGSEGSALRREPLMLAGVYHPPNVSSEPLTPDSVLALTFGDEIELVGYDAPQRVAPGDKLRVALYWHAVQSVPVEYKVFVHLLAPGNEILAQDDGLPVGWMYPTTRWQPGEYIRDEHLLTVDPSVPRGDYALFIGLYDVATRDRAVVRDAAGNEIADRRVMLQQIQVR